MGKFIDLTGEKFERLTVKYKLPEKVNGEYVWHCECQCGNECDVKGVNLRRDKTKSCGCLKKESDKKPKGNVKDIVGKKFNHLTVIARHGSDKRGEALWLCECDCANKTKRIVTGNNLRSGHTRSCGCERRSCGEQKIEEILKSNSIIFEQEKAMFKYDTGGYARFDFYINNEYLIEYDGITHYEGSYYGWRTEESVIAQQKRDKIKNEWCKNNNVPLIRIPYTHFDKLCIEDLKLETSNFIVK